MFPLGICKPDQCYIIEGEGRERRERGREGGRGEGGERTCLFVYMFKQFLLF